MPQVVVHSVQISESFFLRAVAELSEKLLIHVSAAEAGEYIFEIGTSSRDLPVSVKFHLTGHTLYDFGLRSSIKRISASKEAFRILQETFEPYGVTYADFADCLKYFPDKELGVIVEELINNKHLNREDPELIKVIEQMYKKLTDLAVE